MLRALITYILILFFTATTLASPVVAQEAMHLPPAGTRLPLSPAFTPPLLKGIKVYHNDPFRFDFILDKGDATETDEQLKADSNRLIKYFLASLTIPEKDLWVNLSPYEKDRIVPEAFGQTEMGRDLLAQDYILKQITASVIYPEEKVGKEVWQKIYAEALKTYGTTDIPVNTFNKVWIIPEKATVYENKNAAFIVESKLKVMLEDDYLARQENTALQAQTAPANGSNIMREVVIPILETEVNQGKNFALLRQVYQSLILATWYKRKIVASVLAQAYVDRQKTSGIDIADKNEKERIWQQYVEAFKKGAYSLVKEEYDSSTQQIIPRKYFSGGTDLAMASAFKTVDSSELPSIPSVRAAVVQMRADLAMNTANKDDGKSDLYSGETAFEMDPEPQTSNDNDYSRGLRKIIKEATTESAKRRFSLSRLGPKLEKYLQEIYGDNSIKIAIVPQGSTLRGYAEDGSDIECDVIILSGEAIEYGVNPNEENMIKEKLRDLLEQVDLKLDALHYVTPLYPLVELIQDPERYFAQQEHVVEVAKLFLPVAYGDADLIEKARRNVIAWIPGKLWESVQSFYLMDVSVHLLQIKKKDNLSAWLKRQNVNPASKKETASFFAVHKQEIGLPPLEVMASIYDPKLHGAAEVVFPTDSTRASEGVKAYKRFVESLPENLREDVREDKLLMMFTGVCPEISSTAIWRLPAEKRSVVIKAIEANSNYRVIEQTGSILNLSAAKTVLEANPNEFPSSDTRWLFNNINEWSRDSDLGTIRYGLLSGFPRNAAVRFVIHQKALEKVKTSLPPTHLLVQHLMLGNKKTSSEKDNLRQQLSLVFGERLAKEEIDALVDYFAINELMGFSGFSSSDLIWAQRLEAIYNDAIIANGMPSRETVIKERAKYREDQLANFKRIQSNVQKNPDDAQLAPSENTGGVDFNAEKLSISVKTKEDIVFSIDPAMLQRMQNASGLNPVIIGILPLTDLSQFLGVSK